MSDFNLPEGWARTQLGNAIDYGKCEKAEPLSIDNNAWVLELEDVEKDTSKIIQFLTFAERQSKSTKNKFKKGDVLYGKLRPYLNKVVMANSDGVCTTEIIPLNGDEFVNNKYIFYWLKTADFLTYVTAVGYGVNMPRLGTEDGKAAPFVLAPLAEQQQIAQKLDELLAQVDTLKTRLDAIPKILKRFRQSVLAAAVSGRLTEEWRGRNIKWPKKKLREICLSISDGDHQAPPRAESGIPFLVISNVNKGFIDFSKVERWVPQYYFDELKDIRRPKRNDILYTVTGSFGIPVLVDSDQDFCFQRHIAILKPNPNCLNYKFLFFLLGSSQAFKQADSVATGTAQRTVALNSLRDFEFGIPALEEQTEIVRRVEQLFAYADQIEQRVKDAQARVNHLTQSILAKAFRGELTADWRAQNPELISGENSAAALLERIKAEREAAVNPKRKAKAAVAAKR